MQSSHDSTAASNGLRLPRADDQERHLITCLLGWPQRAGEILPLLKPTDFFDPLHAKLWRAFKTQFDTSGEIDPVSVGKQLDCSLLLFELSQNVSTSAYAHVSAEAVRDAARGRQLHEIATKAAEALLRGRPVDSVAGQLHLALDAFEEASK